jgi:predicted nucleic acid-binding protein
MIDTNTVSYIVKGNSLASRAKLAALQYDEIVCISAITETELQYGVAKSPNARDSPSSPGRVLGHGSTDTSSRGSHDRVLTFCRNSAWCAAKS